MLLPPELAEELSVRRYEFLLHIIRGLCPDDFEISKWANDFISFHENIYKSETEVYVDGIHVGKVSLQEFEGKLRWNYEPYLRIKVPLNPSRTVTDCLTPTSASQRKNTFHFWR